MGAKFYSESILIFQKCGTRFFKKTEPYLGLPQIVSPFYNSEFDWNKVKYVIVRPPSDVFLSSLHTEYFNIKRIGGSEIIINKMLDVVEGGGHFHPKQNEYLYHYWCDYNFKTINISNLSLFTKLMTGIEISIENSDTYLEFSKNITKEKTFNFFKEKYLKKIEKLLRLVEEDNIWYKRLLEKSRLTSF